MPELMPPPAGRFIRVSGVRLHFVERGRGPPVLLLHGNGATWQDFEISGLMDALAKRHRVIAFDRPGFGHSTRPFWRRWTAARQARLLMRAARRLGVERPIVVGHSWGALVALHAGIAFPDAIGGLALIAGYYVPERRWELTVLSVPGLPVIGRLLCYTIVPVLARRYFVVAVRRIFAPNPVPERFRRRFPASLALRPSQLLATSQDSAMLNASAAGAQRQLSRVRPPVLIVAGEEDAIVGTERHSVGLHRRVPGSVLLLFAGAGHMVHYFVPEAIADEIGKLAGRLNAA